MKMFFHIGRYFLLIKETFGRPERLSLYWSRTLEEMDLLGVKSLGIVALLSAFMGAVITIQTKTNIDSPLIQAWVVGFAARQSTILEFSPTIISLILAGKVGSNIAAEIGSMRVKEQIDALDIMVSRAKCAYLCATQGARRRLFFQSGCGKSAGSLPGLPALSFAVLQCADAL
mgnify:CR=1 FL=1